MGNHLPTRTLMTQRSAFLFSNGTRKKRRCHSNTRCCFRQITSKRVVRSSAGAGAIYPPILEVICGAYLLQGARTTPPPPRAKHFPPTQGFKEKLNLKISHVPKQPYQRENGQVLTGKGPCGGADREFGPTPTSGHGIHGQEKSSWNLGLKQHTVATICKAVLTPLPPNPPAPTPQLPSYPASGS